MTISYDIFHRWVALALILAQFEFHAFTAESESTLAPASAQASKPLAIAHGPILQAPSETGVTISWVTSRKCVSRVEYRTESSAQWFSAIPSHFCLVDAEGTHHNVALTDLSPGTRYIYRLVSREIVDFKFY